MQTNNTEEQELITDVAIIEHDKEIDKILQDDDLKTLEDTMKKVSTFKRKYTPKKLAVTDIDNKEQLERLRLGRAELRSTRTELDRVRKERNKPYQDTINFINGNYNKAIEIIENLEKPLKLIKEEVDEKIAARDKEEQLKKERKIKDRVAKLLDAGITFVEDFYQIGSEQFNVPFTTLGIVHIADLSDVAFDIVLEEVKRKNAIITQEQEKADSLKREQEEARIKKEAEEKRVFAEEQEKLKKEQEAMKKEREELEQMRKEMQEAKDKVEQERQEEERRRINAIIDVRRQQLIDLGMEFDRINHDYFFEGVTVNESDLLQVLPQNEWDAIIDRIAPVIIEKLEAKKQLIIEKQLAEEKRIAEKAIADQKARDEEAERVRQENLAKEGDKAVWEDFIIRLKLTKYPEMKTTAFRGKVIAVANYINDLK